MAKDDDKKAAKDVEDAKGDADEPEAEDVEAASEDAGDGDSDEAKASDSEADDEEDASEDAADADDADAVDEAKDGPEKEDPDSGKASAKKDAKASSKGKAKPPKAEASKADKAKDEPKAQPHKPRKVGDDELISADIPELFGLEGNDEETATDYEPEIATGIPIGGLVALIVIIALLVGGGWYAIQVLKQRQTELEDAERQAKAQAEANKVPDIRYGNLALLASTPAKALILQNGNPVYAKTTSGAWTVLRTGPSTRVQNIKISEDEPVRFTLLSEGYKAYELEIGEYDWVPIPGTGDWEKVYNNVRLEPQERPFLMNCLDVAALGAPYANVCRNTVTDEIVTRSDFERIYDARLTGTITVESDPPGAKIFFLSKPLLLPDGNQAVTPHQLTYHGKDDKGVDKPVYITDELSVRLEKEGLEPYITEIHTHQWKCEPSADPLVLSKKDYVIPEKIEASSPDLPHHLCKYSVKVNGKLFEPKPEDDEKKPEAP